MPSEFLLAYQELVRLADNDPTDLVARAERSAALKTACDNMERAATAIWIEDRYSPDRFVPHASKAEIDAIADYQRRWKRVVRETNPLLRGLFRNLPKQQYKSEQERIRDAVEDGEILARRFDALIEFAREHASAENEEEFWEWAYDAVSVWNDLCIRGDFRLAHVLAALELVPFVRMPVEVSNKHGSAEAISLFTRLRDAQRAFVYGCYLSCAAMQRAILEDVLPRKRDKERIPDLIKACALDDLMKQGLRDINKLANEVLHANLYEPPEKFGRTDVIVQLVRGLITLKRAIEAGPIERVENP